MTNRVLNQSVFNGADDAYRWATYSAATGGVRLRVGEPGIENGLVKRPWLGSEVKGFEMPQLKDGELPFGDEVLVRAGGEVAAPGPGPAPGPQYPIFHPRGVHQYAEEIYVWFDEAGLLGGVGYSLDDAYAQMGRYASSSLEPTAADLVPGFVERANRDTADEMRTLDVLQARQPLEDAKARAQLLYEGDALSLSQFMAIFGVRP